MSFGVTRIHKIKVSAGGEVTRRYEHAFRKRISANVDTERVELDECYGPESRVEFFRQLRARQRLATSRRSDNVGLLEVMVTTTDGLPQGDEKDWIKDSVDVIKSMYGEENFLGYAVHHDEKETHIHAFVVPLQTKKIEKTRLTLEEEERLQAACRTHGIQFQRPPKKPEKSCTDKAVWDGYKAAQKSYEAFKKAAKPLLAEIGAVKTETVLDAQKFCADRQTMSRFQDAWWELVSKKYGLERGEKNSQKTYAPTDLHKWHERLKQQEKYAYERDRSLSERSEKLNDDITRLNEKIRDFNKLNHDVVANKLKMTAALQRLDYNGAVEAAGNAIAGLTTVIHRQAGQIEELQDKLKPAQESLQKWRNRSPEELENFASYLREHNAANAQELLDRQNAPKKSQNRGYSR